jgi:UDP-glucose 4-epimerase
MRVLVAGGAGFLGSHIVDALARRGHGVVVVDGLMAQTGGNPENLRQHQDIEVLSSPVEECHGLGPLLERIDLVVDCMGWTRHMLAVEDPLRDLRLNLHSHLVLLDAIGRSSCRRLIYLGSRGQYGNPPGEWIHEDTPQEPCDVQGIHKSAAEHHMRVFSRRTGASIASLRFGAAYGERLPLDGADVGLFGGFLRDVLAGRQIELYGSGRRREFVYAPDVAQAVCMLAEKGWSGFEAFNLGGQAVGLDKLCEMMVALAGRGSVVNLALPAGIAAMDTGAAMLRDDKLCRHIGELARTPLGQGICRLISQLNTEIEA